MASNIKTYNVRDMFNFWVRNKRRERPYLIFKYPSRTKNSELWYQVKPEIEFLKNKLFELDTEIQQLEIKDRDITRFTAITKDIFEKKKELYDIKKKLIELEKENPNKEVKLMDFYTFRDIVYSYNKKAANAIIQGARLNLNEKLGHMFITKVNKSSKLINWEESKAYKKELLDKGLQPKDKEHPNGKNWLVYYDSPYYFRWSWQKRNGACRVKNHTVYGFYPAGRSSKGVPGAKTLLVQANKNNPALHLNYVTR